MIDFAFDHTYKNLPNSSIEERFKVKFKPISRPPKSWKEELLISADKIVKSTDRPIYVLMSGGIDSEQTAKILMELGVKFKVLTMKHKDGLNWFDIKYAVDFCNKYKIEQRFVELDTQHFFSEGIKKYIERDYRSVNIYHYQQLFLLDHLEEIGGFGFGGAGEQVYFTVNGEICLSINPNYPLGVDYCRRNNLNHNFWLNLSTPEIYAAYMKIDLIDWLLKRPEYFTNTQISRLTISGEKVLIYHQHWPEMQKRQKYSGFEKIEKSIRQPKQSELTKQFPDLVDLFIPVAKVKKELGIS